MGFAGFFVFAGFYALLTGQPGWPLSILVLQQQAISYDDYVKNIQTSKTTFQLAGWMFTILLGGGGAFVLRRLPKLLKESFQPREKQ